MPVSKREIAPSETIGWKHGCSLPTVRKAMSFACPACGLKAQMQVHDHHLPWCPKDNWLMHEIELW